MAQRCFSYDRNECQSGLNIARVEWSIVILQLHFSWKCNITFQSWTKIYSAVTFVLEIGQWLQTLDIVSRWSTEIK